MSNDKTGPKLTPEQLNYFALKKVKKGTPCRFLFKGRNLSISTGELQSKGTNIMYQIVYWNFTPGTAKQIAKILGCRVVITE